MSPVPKRLLRWVVVMLMVMVMALSLGCRSRPELPVGDPGGVLVEVTVDFTWQYLETMSRWEPPPPSTTVLIAPSPWVFGPGIINPRWHTGYGYRGGYYGPSFGYYQVISPDPGYQDVFLLAGNGPAQAELFHKRLRPGHHRFLMTIRPGRTVTLTVQATGNRDGWAVIGHFTSADGDGGRLHITCDAEGSAMQAYPPPEVSGTATPSASGTDPAMPMDGSPEVAPADEQKAPEAPAPSAPPASPASPTLRTF